MKTKYILKGLIAAVLLVSIISGCESYNEEVMESLGISENFLH